MKTMYMKKNGLALAALTLAFALGLAGCGEFAAKTLAKQTSDAAKKMTALQEKAADIEERATGLSARERRIYQRELTRLGIGDAPEWLFSDEAALLSGAPEATEGEDDDDTGKAKAKERRSARSSGGGGEGKLTVTGLPMPSENWNAVVLAPGADVSTMSAIAMAVTPDPTTGKYLYYLAVGTPPSGNVFDLFNAPINMMPWTGSGSFTVVLMNTTAQVISEWTATVNFSNRNATVPFSQFTQVTKVK